MCRFSSCQCCIESHPGNWQRAMVEWKNVSFQTWIASKISELARLFSEYMYTAPHLIFVPSNLRFFRHILQEKHQQELSFCFLLRIIIIKRKNPIRLLNARRKLNSSHLKCLKGRISRNTSFVEMLTIWKSDRIHVVYQWW